MCCYQCRLRGRFCAVLQQVPQELIPGICSPAQNPLSCCNSMACRKSEMPSEAYAQQCCTEGSRTQVRC